MAAPAAMTEDPLSIFDEMIDNAVAHDQGGENQATSGNLFDPLVFDGNSSNADSDANNNGDGLDLLSQIASWGAENKDPAAEEQDQEIDTSTTTEKETTTTTTTPNANVMAATDDKAIELSDDLVANAHQEFEATADKLAEFEQKEEKEQHAQ